MAIKQFPQTSETVCLKSRSQTVGANYFTMFEKRMNNVFELGDEINKITVTTTTRQIWIIDKFSKILITIAYFRIMRIFESGPGRPSSEGFCV